MMMRVLICGIIGVFLSKASDAIDVPTVALSQRGVMMPAIAAGTWQYNDSVAEQAVTTAFEVGFTHIDTADDYDNQVGVGRALQGRDRDSFFLTTKVPGCGVNNISRTSCGEDSYNAVKENLKELQLDYTDLLLVHFPPSGGCGKLNCKIIQQQWTALEKAYNEKLTRALGVSNFCMSCFECIAQVSDLVPAVNQVQYHVGMGPDPGSIRSYCSDRGIALQAYSPLGNNASAILSNPVLQNIGANHNKSSVQIALKWVWQNGVAIATKSTSAKHLADDIDLFDWDLNEDEMKAMNNLNQPSGTYSFMCTK